MYNWKTEVMEYWVPSKTKLRKNGEPVIFRNVIRKLHLHTDKPVIEPANYQITQVKRAGEVMFAIKGFIEPKKPQWYTPLAHGSLPEGKWQKAEKSKNLSELIAWLGLHCGVDEAWNAMRHLFADEPQNRE